MPMSSAQTVAFAQNIMEKLGVETRTAAARVTMEVFGR